MDHLNQVIVQIDERFTEAVDAGEIERQVIRALQVVAPAEPATLTIVITGDTTSQDLNRDYLGIDAPTDVLAFSQAEGATIPNLGTEPRYLGDVIVSYERAVAQADELNEPLERELSRLVIHGTLHLLGYDDQRETDRQRMWEIQERLLAWTSQNR
jgi:probable rRNA maturation factor